MPPWSDLREAPQERLRQELRHILTTRDEGEVEALMHSAHSMAVSIFGYQVYIRGLIEISNHCKNNCYYCGIRRGNRNLLRYRLTDEQILDCCREGFALGFRTFVWQAGEDPGRSDDSLITLVAKVKDLYPSVAITLSLGERERSVYQALFDAGADRYLLRHETYDPQHYAYLHPQHMSRDRRIECLYTLKDIGFQTGAGMMVGSPSQTIDNLLDDLLFLRDLSPEMIGIGPFIPHDRTPFRTYPNGSVDLTLRVLAVSRLLCPQALIPSTTALASLPNENGRLRGILAGANVVMPNLSPKENRAKYALYNNKAYEKGESAQGLQVLADQLTSIGYTISYDRGDYPGRLFA